MNAATAALADDGWNRGGPHGNVLIYVKAQRRDRGIGPGVLAARSPVLMATYIEQQSWYPEWRETIERVITAQEVRDKEKPGTPVWEAADAEYQAALAAYRILADQIR